ELAHPGGVVAAAGVLLLAAYASQAVQSPTYWPIALRQPLGQAPAAISRLPAISEAPQPEPVPGTSSPGTGASIAAAPFVGPRTEASAPVVSLPQVPPALSGIPMGPAAPPRGREWKGTVLPAFSPE